MLAEAALKTVRLVTPTSPTSTLKLTWRQPHSWITKWRTSSKRRPQSSPPRSPTSTRSRSTSTPTAQKRLAGIRPAGTPWNEEDETGRASTINGSPGYIAFPNLNDDCGYDTVNHSRFLIYTMTVIRYSKHLRKTKTENDFRTFLLPSHLVARIVGSNYNHVSRSRS